MAKKTENRATTLRTQEAPARQRTLPKGKPDGTARQLQEVPVETLENDDETWQDDPALEDAPEVVDEPELEEESEPLAASEAEPDPEPEEAPKRRGRKPGSTNAKKPIAAATATNGGGDLMTSLSNEAFAIKQLATAHGKSPKQVLAAVGTILEVAETLEAGA